jgi:hypothetical protein
LDIGEARFDVVKLGLQILHRSPKIVSSASALIAHKIEGFRVRATVLQLLSFRGSLICGVMSVVGCGPQVVEVARTAIDIDGRSNRLRD